MSKLFTSLAVSMFYISNQHAIASCKDVYYYKRDFPKEVIPILEQIGMKEAPRVEFFVKKGERFVSTIHSKTFIEDINLRNVFNVTINMYTAKKDGARYFDDYILVSQDLVNNQRLTEYSNEARYYFDNFMRSYVTIKTMNEFCEWAAAQQP